MRVYIESTNVRWAEYPAKVHFDDGYVNTLVVQFVNDRVYAYVGATEDDFVRVVSSPSPGRVLDGMKNRCTPVEISCPNPSM